MICMISVYHDITEREFRLNVNLLVQTPKKIEVKPQKFSIQKPGICPEALPAMSYLHHRLHLQGAGTEYSAIITV